MSLSYNINVIDTLEISSSSGERIKLKELLKVVSKYQGSDTIEHAKERVRIVLKNTEEEVAGSNFSSLELPDFNDSGVLNESLILDKLVITLKLSEKSCRGFLKRLRSDKSVELSRNQANQNSKYLQIFTVREPLSGSQLVLGAFSISNAIGNLRIEYNPSKQDLALLKVLGALQNLLGERYKRKIRAAKITRVDLAVDFIGTALCDLLVLKNRCRFHTVYATKCAIESINLGQGGGCRIVAYDKRKELGVGSLETDTNAVHHTRIESQFRPYKHSKTKEGVRLKEYYSIPCVFDNVKIFDISGAPEALSEFVLIIQLVGHKALKDRLTRREWQKLQKQLQNLIIPLDLNNVKKLQDLLLKRELKFLTNPPSFLLN